MIKQFKVNVTIDDQVGVKYYIYALSKEHAEFIVMNYYELSGKSYLYVDAVEVK